MRRQVFKEFLDELVSNGDVECEKIGSTNVYFSFPGKEVYRVKMEFTSLQRQLAAAQEESKQLQERKRKLQESNPLSESRRMKMHRVSELEKSISSIRDQMKQKSGIDPERFERLQQAQTVCSEGASRWLENLYALLDWTRKRGSQITTDEFFQNLGWKSTPTDDI